MRKFLTAAAIESVPRPSWPRPVHRRSRRSDHRQPDANVETQEFRSGACGASSRGSAPLRMLQPVETETGEPVIAVVIPSSAENQPLVAWVMLPLGVLCRRASL